MSHIKIFTRIIILACTIISNLLLCDKTGVISKEYIQQFLPKNPVVLEAGAHIGRDTVEMSNMWPQATIFAFEPVPTLFQELLSNTNAHSNVFCFQVALSNKTGTATFHMSSGDSDGSGSLLPPSSHLTDHPDVFFNDDFEVQTITLKKWALAYSVPRIDFMWLDMQGAELDMLKEAGPILKTVKVIYTEVSLKETYQGVPLYKEVRSWLEQQGFKVVREELPWNDMGNVLFVRS